MTMIIPMAAVVFYIFGIGVATFMVRKRAVMSKAVSFKYFRVYDAKESSPPEFLVRMGRHYDNQMQLPPFFLITGLTCLFYGLHGWIPVTLGWIFLASRVAHTYFHLSSNNVLRRAAAFAVGWIVIVILWIIILTQGMTIPAL